MPYSIVRQRVEHYARWRRAFDENAEGRAEAGSRGGHLFRVPEDPEQLVIFLAWEDLERARRYLEGAPQVAEEEATGGVTDRDVLLLEELGRPAS